jgi:hypothetical protein
MLAVLIAAALLLMLVAKAWRAVAPQAMQTVDAPDSGPLRDYGQTGAASGVRSGDLPGLDETRRETDEHAAAVQEALDTIE